jgi:signal transduction histidine kinase
METLASPQAYVEASSTAGILSIPAVDITMYLLIAVLIVMAIVLSNKHLKTSRESIKISERLIGRERELFEHRIAERTAAYIRSEEQRLVELERNATFGELSKGLFHDLMNPLSSLTLYAERMGERTDISDVSKDMVKKMIDTSRRLGSYMDSVRRYIGQEQRGEPHSSDVGYEIGIVRDLLGYKARMLGVELSIEQKEPIMLSIHPVRLHQLLLNLVSNAIEACEDLKRGHHTVTISASRNNGSVCISVADTGVGIPPERLASLFKESFTTKEKGTGIGLKTIRSVVEQDLRGTIEVNSEVGKGTKFTIDIPINSERNNA